MDPLDLVSAAPWRSVSFTTFALSLSFFEAVVLDRLIRGGGQSALILADPEGIRSGLSEEGARRAGRDYEIEPIECRTGVFHPKLSVFEAPDDLHLLVGSGNLTFGGWGGNLEVTEHLHPSFAADAIDDAADFFELLTMSERILTEASHQCLTLAERLRLSTRGAPRSGSIRLVHSVGGSIATEIARYADELGGARKITLVSPYHDLNGGGLEALGSALSCDAIYLHAHPDGTVRGTGAHCWPFEARGTYPAVNVRDLFAADKRMLHAKAIEVMCRRGRILVSGSANGTHPGLFGANVEASVLRLQRDVLVGWQPTAAEPPDRFDADDNADEAEADAISGIVRASLEGGRIKGRVLSPNMAGEAMISVRSVRRTRPLGATVVDAGGRFSINAPMLDHEAWESGRLVVRIEQGNKVAEGFVSIAAASKLVRRVGPMATRIFAILAGSDTPADVAALLAWFREDPDRLPRAGRQVVGGSGDGAELEATFVQTASLQTSSNVGREQGDEGTGSSAWRHAMALLRAAFSAPRGPWNAGRENDDNDDEDQTARERRARQQDQQNAKSLEHFEALMPKMLEPGTAVFDPLLALAMTHFVADRIRPPAAKLRLWLGKILPATISFSAPSATPAIATVLLAYGTDGLPNGPARARRLLLERAGDPDMPASIDGSEMPAFVEIISPLFDFKAFAAQVRSAKTVSEEVQIYLAAVATGELSTPLPTLVQSPHWPRLEKAISDPAMLEKFIIFDRAATGCPRCYMAFPRATHEDLGKLGVATCCGRILLNRAL